MLVWLDTADSTGTCMFDVMPYVDLYFKKQLLKIQKITVVMYMVHVHFANTITINYTLKMKPSLNATTLTLKNNTLTNCV